MTPFFVGWELWEDMTFSRWQTDAARRQVLACCIVVVFLFGAVRLWLSNRKLRKHEVIDEERRLRLAEMRHCGIDALRIANEIPFGVRALESGIEVEGIWISRSNTPDGCRTPASTTPVDEQMPGKGKERMVEPRRHHSPPDAPHRITLMDRPVTLADRPDDAENASLEEGRSSGDEHGTSHTPMGFHDGQRAVHDSHPSRGWRASAMPLSETQQRLLVAGPVSGRDLVDFPSDAAPYGAAAVYANRSTRRLNTGFEVLPAGVLGPRQEFLAHGGAEAEVDDVARQLRQPSKLQKRPRG
ncbi:hypothetical protein G6O67_006952 [Ophiocordyceps sinensis]|uniref:Uncharacterized protein n=2 Tax=Ophiocordyceps sinensis TaxID=72228 RepID=A0A8H4LU51_9HYPO|nr:hypothetical protein OCS_06032 [Ophiocordyceps sinensis CO18]KAF4504947.1 hypothetical protein G6O67_006952 [Ophiocordyceps sinensis]